LSHYFSLLRIIKKNEFLQKNMKTIFTFAFLLCLVYGLQAQEDQIPTQSVFVEIGGPSLVYTFNYDFRFDKSDLNSWGLRAGIGGYKLSDEALLTIPIQATRLFGKKVHFFEVGGGFTFINYKSTFSHYSAVQDPQTGEWTETHVEETRKDWSFILDIDETPAVLGTLNFGYRRIPEDGGFTFRANITPIFNNHGFWPLFAGIGLGYAF
jgi:hypothetical protein